MATIASPRIPTPQSPSSSRSSLSLERPGAASNASIRRNRAALRDYYNLPAASSSTLSAQAAQPPAQSGDDTIPHSAFDETSFDADAYTAALLSHAGLEELLGVEARLVSEIRGLDGERKALVYDNYGKLIGVTETIRSVTGAREEGFGGEGGGGLADGDTRKVKNWMEGIVGRVEGVVEKEKKAAPTELGHEESDTERQTVRYVLDTPRRLRILVEDGKMDEATADWGEIEAILKKWEGVNGVEEVRKDSLEALQHE